MDGLDWWWWGVIGFILLMIELFTMPFFVMIWFGLGAFLVMLLSLLFPFSLTGQFGLWTASSLLMVVLWFKLLKQYFLTKSQAGQSSAAIIGEVGMIAESVAPFKNGKVRFQKPIIGSEIWECMADEAIEVGTKVKVLSVEGNQLKVGRREA